MLLYNSSNLNLGLRISLIDNFSGPAARISGAFKNLKNEKSLFEANARAGRDMYRSLAMAGTAATLGMGAAYNRGAKFEYIIRGVSAAAEATSEEFEQLKKTANALGGTTMFTPTEVGTAMEMLAKAGYTANQVLSATSPIVNLAGAAMEDIGLSADIAVSTMYQFGMEASNMTYITDLLTQAALKSNVGLKDLGESLKYASATAVDLGQDLPTVLSLIMTLGNAGMKGSMAGVGIENMYRYMALGLGQFRKLGRSEAWEKAGLDPTKLVDAKGNLVPIINILEQLSNALSKFGDVDQQNLLFQIFGVRGKRPPSKFIQDLSQIRGHMNSLEMAGGKAANMMKFMMEGPRGEWLKLLAAMESMANAFAEALAPVVIPIMWGLNKIFTGISWFMNSIVGSGITRILAVGIVLKTVVWGVKSAIFGVSLALSSLGGTLLGIKTAWVTSMAQMKAATAQLAGATAITGAGGAIMGYGRRVTNPNIRQTSNGRFYQVFPGTGRGARFISTAEATRLKTGKNALLRTMFSGAGLASMGRGVMAFLGGPVGMGIMGISLVLPLILRGLNKNTEATEESNQVIQDGARESRKLISMMANEFSGLKNTYIRQLYNSSGYGSDNTDFILARRLNEYKQSPNLFGKREFYDYSNPDRIDIYLDGNLTKTIERKINRNINTQLNIGL
jgi:TP901 family phage tail tape measure protein